MTVKNIHQKRHQLRKLRGETAYLDVTPAVQHIHTLTGAGWSLRAIAGACEVPVTVLSRIRSGQQTSAAPETLRRILTLDPVQVPSRPSKQTNEPFVPRIGTVRRLQALLWMGWGHQQMRAHCGLNTAGVLHQQGRWVTRSTHDRIATMFTDLWSQAGPSSKARTYARQRGYHPPLAWDDIDHDHEPAAQVDLDADYLDETAISRRMEGDRSVALTTAEAVELVALWQAAGRSLDECARVTGLRAGRYLRQGSR